MWADWNKCADEFKDIIDLSYQVAPVGLSTFRSISKKGLLVFPTRCWFLSLCARSWSRSFPLSPSSRHRSILTFTIPPRCSSFDRVLPLDPKISPTSKSAVPMTGCGNCPFRMRVLLEEFVTTFKTEWASCKASWFSDIPAVFASKSNTPTSI